MSTYSKLTDLPIKVEGYELDGLSFKANESFERLSTLIRIHGGGEEGQGEDVTYSGLDQIALQDAGAPLDLTGPATFGEFCDLIGSLDTFPVEPELDVSRLYRRWAFESAGLDLALRQSGITLASALDIEPSPVNFVVSMRLSPGPEVKSSIEPMLKRLNAYPGQQFKLDPTNDWDDELIAQLVETGAVDSLDLKGQYSGTPVDVDTDPVLYRKLAEAFPDAWLEDPDLNNETNEVLKPYRDRITWDAPIHGIADIEALAFAPKMVNIKPSRLGGVESLLNTYDYCAEHGIRNYGGGQWELGQGRGQIQYMASLFHPDTPNDTAPSGYNDPNVPAGLPLNPLQPTISETGFRWE